MAPDLEDPYRAYMDAFRRRVCAACLDQRNDGTCGLAGGRLCAIEAHLPRLVEAVLAISSDRMDPYVDAARDRICRDCLGQDSQGDCSFREGGECALWTYLPLLVDAVEEVQLTRPSRP